MEYRRSRNASAGTDDVDRVDGFMDVIPEPGRGSKGHRHIKIPRAQEDHHRFVSNHISTAKYNIISFLPKFLFEQFRRYANIFFLTIGLMQQIPNVSPTGRYVTIVPFLAILTLTAIKELIEDMKRHRADDKVNKGNALVFDRLRGKFVTKFWKDVVVGDVVKCVNGEFFPADLVLLASSEPQGMCNIETSNLDGETNLKIRSGIPLTFESLGSEEQLRQMSSVIECEEPNRNLYEFNGNIRLGRGDMTPLAPSSVLLRGSKLMNTRWIYGVVIYTGHETKLLMNSNRAPLKRSNIDKITNYQIIFLFMILIIISLMSAIGNLVLSYNGEDHTYVYRSVGQPSKPLKKVDRAANFFLDLLTFVILYNNLIPISLQVTLEFVKFIQVYFINWDTEMYYQPTDTYAIARTSNLNEELGQIKYVFSDKTGTLTQNVMEYKRASIAGVLYDPQDPNLIQDLKKKNSQVIKDFVVLMSVCHTVIPEEDDGKIIYNASSPDERALVEGAATYGFKFVARKPESVIIQTPLGQDEEYEVLNIVEFTSSRKRMSVICRCPDGKIKLFIKGADSIILDRLGSSPTEQLYRDVTINHLEEFATEGLRTLCLASREISAEDYKNFSDMFYKASLSLENRDEAIEDVATLIEQKLTLLGATAIEDKLQDGVPETISQLIEAHINVWVLTGDKQETAINIGHACKLLSESVPVIILNAGSLDEARKDITHHLSKFRSQGTVGRYVSFNINSLTTCSMFHSFQEERTLACG